MVANLNWCDRKIADLTLKEVYQQANLDQPHDIPWIIKLFENPCSPIALPGNISLHDHDCLHILLGRGVTPQDEAFVIGFTMGSDRQTKFWHLLFFKLLSQYIYPSKYRFNHLDFKIFDLGFEYGRTLFPSNLNQLNFKLFYNYRIKTLRSLFGININLISSIMT